MYTPHDFVDAGLFVFAFLDFVSVFVAACTALSPTATRIALSGKASADASSMVRKILIASSMTTKTFARQPQYLMCVEPSKCALCFLLMIHEGAGRPTLEEIRDA